MSLSWKFAHNLRLKVFSASCVWLSSKPSPQSQSQSSHTLTHTWLQSRANVYIIWTAVAVALATSFLTSLLLRLSRALSFDPCLQSVGVMFELHSTGVALLCFFCCLYFFCFILFCSFLCSLLSSADAAAAGALLFCFMANVFASLGSAIKHGRVG